MLIRPTLQNKYRRKDGRCVVKIEIYISEKDRRFIKTDFYVNPDTEWNQAERKVNKNRANHEAINTSLKKLCIAYEEKYLQGAKSTEDILTEKVTMTFVEFIKDYGERLKAGKILNTNGRPMADNTIRTFPTYSNYIISFFKYANHNYSFKEIDRDFYQDFIIYLRHEFERSKTRKGLSENTIVKAIKTVKALMRKARKYHDNREYDDYSVSYFDTETIALTDAEIEKIVNLDLSGQPHLETERDRFIVAYNFLLRFNDSLNIDRADMRTINGKHYLDFSTQKTRSRVFLPVFAKTMEILEKYNYNMPGTTNQEANWKLKEIGKLASITEPVTINEVLKGKFVKKTVPKYKLITTHTSRRSMATNMYLAGIELKSIQIFGGWRSIQMLEKYLKIDKQALAVKATDHPFFKDK